MQLDLLSNVSQWVYVCVDACVSTFTASSCDDRKLEEIYQQEAKTKAYGNGQNKIRAAERAQKTD